MISRDEIASNATPAFRYPLERLFSDEDVAVAARRVEAATSLVDLKVLAYANHIGAMTPDEALRKLGEPRAVVDTLRSMLKSLGVVDQRRLTEALSGGAAGYSGRATANNQSEGWALTLFDLLHQSELPNWY